MPYQSVMRVIGRDLDRLQATYVRLIELPTGFAVQYVTPKSETTIVTVEFTMSELMARAEPGLLQPLLRRPVGPRRTFSGKPTYQNLFRALGYELEDAGAYSILLDELDDGFLLTYQFYNPESGFMLHKHRVALHADEAGKIVNVASMRRGRIVRRPSA